jgi:transcriptional regulator with XRE-family HTH domain
MPVSAMPVASGLSRRLSMTICEVATLPRICEREKVRTSRHRAVTCIPMKTPAQRGTHGNWLRDARLARGYSSAEAARLDFERLTGRHIAKSVWAQYEAGSRAPSERHLPWLEEWYGEAPAASADQDDLTRLVSAVEAQTAALVALVEELRTAREEQLGRDEGLAVALGKIEGTLGRLAPVRVGKRQTNSE